jgi:hypothetical protein
MKPQRRIFFRSKGTLAICVAGCMMATAYGAWRLKAGQEQWLALASLRGTSVDLCVGYSCQPNGSFSAWPVKEVAGAWPSWLYDYLGVDTVYRVVSLRLRYLGTMPEDLDALRRLRHLKSLSLAGGYSLDTRALESLRELGELEDLSLDDDNLSISDVVELSEELPRLRHLTLIGAFDQTELERLATLKNLGELTLVSTHLTTSARNRIQAIMPFCRVN